MLSHIAAQLYGAPLMIHRPKLDVILAVLGERIGLTRALIKPPRDWQDPEEEKQAKSGIAVIPVYGTLVRRTMGLEAQSGLTSYGNIATQVANALTDPAIAGIVLDIDSTGGESGGVFDLVDALYASRGVKPIWAIANDSCFSAAYAIASAADRLFVTRTGGIGSIGVIALHVDQSAADAKEGLTYTAISAGLHKNDLSPHAPLQDSAKSALQTEVNRIYELFSQTVARNRGRSSDFVRKTDAALFFGPDAVTAGLADGVASFSDVMTQLNNEISSTPAVVSAIPSLLQEVIMQQKEKTSTPVAETPQPTPETPPAASTPSVATPQPVSKEQQVGTGRQFDHAVEIAQLCQLAGMSDKTADFLASGQTVTQVRQALLAAKASIPTISSHIDPQHHPLRTDLLVNVMKQRLGKELK